MRVKRQYGIFCLKKELSMEALRSSFGLKKPTKNNFGNLPDNAFSLAISSVSKRYHFSHVKGAWAHFLYNMIFYCKARKPVA